MFICEYMFIFNMWIFTNLNVVIRIFNFKITIVEVNGWYHWVTWVNNSTYTSSKEWQLITFSKILASEINPYYTTAYLKKADAVLFKYSDEYHSHLTIYVPLLRLAFLYNSVNLRFNLSHNKVLKFITS